MYFRGMGYERFTVVRLKGTDIVRFRFIPRPTEPMRHTLTTTAQYSDILCLMLLEMVSCRTHSGIVHWLPVRVATVQLRGIRLHDAMCNGVW